MFPSFSKETANIFLGGFQGNQGVGGSFALLAMTAAINLLKQHLSPQVGAVLDERGRRGIPSRGSISAYHNFCFPEENVAGVRRAARTIWPSGERLLALSAKARRRPGRALYQCKGGRGAKLAVSRRGCCNSCALFRSAFSVATTTGLRDFDRLVREGPPAPSPACRFASLTQPRNRPPRRKGKRRSAWRSRISTRRR